MLLQPLHGEINKEKQIVPGFFQRTNDEDQADNAMRCWRTVRDVHEQGVRQRGSYCVVEVSIQLGFDARKKHVVGGFARKATTTEHDLKTTKKHLQTTMSNTINAMHGFTTKKQNDENTMADSADEKDAIDAGMQENLNFITGRAGQEVVAGLSRKLQHV